MTWLEQITPWLPLMGTIAGAGVVGGFAVHNRRRGNEEQKMPTVAEIWAREERKSLQLDALHSAYARIRGAFSAYVLRVRAGGDPTPTESEKRFLTLSSTEASATEQKEQPNA